jgi:hypothetical protein
VTLVAALNAGMVVQIWLACAFTRISSEPFASHLHFPCFVSHFLLNFSHFFTFLVVVSLLINQNDYGKCKDNAKKCKMQKKKKRKKVENAKITQKVENAKITQKVENAKITK